MMSKIYLTFVAILSTISFSLFSQSDAEKIDAFVNKNVIKGQIHFLALDALQGRDMGSPGLELAADFIRSEFRSANVKYAPGMDGYDQGLDMVKVSPAQNTSLQINEGKPLTAPDDFIVIAGDNSTVNGEIIYVPFGTEEDLKGIDVKDKILVTQVGDGSEGTPQSWFFGSKAKNQLAKTLGAKAVIELYTSSKAPYNFVKRFLGSRDSYKMGFDENDIGVPHLWLNANESEIVTVLKSNTSTIRLSIDGMSIEKVDTKNIIGFVEGTDPILKNEYIVYSAHYDHVGVGRAVEGDSIYNGARDNAVGTVTVLQMARYVSQNPMKRSALFILFTGEEKGLLGSQFFVDNSPVALEDIVYCFNSDNGGYNDTSVISVVGLERTSAEQLIIDAAKSYGLEAIEDPAKEQGLFDRSDNVNFAKKGIPAPTFSMGFTAFDAEIMKYYHQPGDHAESLDYDYLEKFFKAYVLSGVYIGNAAEAPFWNEGDKYYKSGLLLYGQ